MHVNITLKIELYELFIVRMQYFQTAKLKRNS